MNKQFICHKVLKYDVDILSLITSAIIIILFAIEVLASTWRVTLLSAGIAIAAIVLAIKLLCMPPLSRNYARILSSLDYDDGEQSLLIVRSRLICDHLARPGYLVVTNRRIVFIGKDSKKESIVLSSIISVEGRCRYLGIERWVKIATNDRIMVVSVNYPKCLSLFIESIISGISYE